MYTKCIIFQWRIYKLNEIILTRNKFYVVSSFHADLSFEQQTNELGVDGWKKKRKLLEN